MRSRLKILNGNRWARRISSAFSASRATYFGRLAFAVSINDCFGQDVQSCSRIVSLPARSSRFDGSRRSRSDKYGPHRLQFRARWALRSSRSSSAVLPRRIFAFIFLVVFLIPYAATVVDDIAAGIGLALEEKRHDKIVTHIASLLADIRQH